MVEVYAVKLVEEENYLKSQKELLSLLPESLVLKIERFKRVVNQQRSLLGEVLSRVLISDNTGIKIKDLNIIKSDNGKPELQNFPGLYFNVSHSGEWVVMALAKAPVGIDVEKIKKPVYRIAERYFSQSELENLNSLSGSSKQAYFFDLWTLKESYLKMLGKGLTKSLGSFTIIGSNGVFSLINDKSLKDKVFLKQYNLDPIYKLSVCSEDNKFSSLVQQLEIKQLLNSD